MRISINACVKQDYSKTVLQYCVSHYAMGSRVQQVVGRVLWAVYLRTTKAEVGLRVSGPQCGRCGEEVAQGVSGNVRHDAVNLMAKRAMLGVHTEVRYSHVFGASGCH